MALKKNLREWIKWEKSFNDFYVRPNAFAAFPKKKSLNSLKNIKYLYQVHIPVKKLFIHKYRPTKCITKHFLNSKTTIPVLIHPFAATELENAKAQGYSIKKVAVRNCHSFRTFFYQDCIVKTSLPTSKDAPDFHKYLLKEQIERSVNICKLLDKELNKQKSAKHGFKYLRESFGINFRSESYPWGMLVREIPEDILRGKKNLISIISYVHKPRGHKSLLERHLKEWQESMEVNLLKNVVAPLIDSFTYIYREHGLIMEAHQQNLLFELDMKKNLTGNIYYRDLEGCRVDFFRRKFLKLSSENLKSVSSIESIYEVEKLNDIRRRFKPQMAKNPHWNGAIEFAYRKFIEHSVLHIIQRSIEKSPALKRKKKPDIIKLGESYLNFVLRNHHPELFK